jgi:hypothetical protein
MMTMTTRGWMMLRFWTTSRRAAEAARQSAFSAAAINARKEKQKKPKTPAHDLQGATQRIQTVNAFLK